MRNVLDILEEIEETAGSNAKHQILEDNSDNTLLQQLLLATYDRFTVYHVNQVPKSKAPKNDHFASDNDAVRDFLERYLVGCSNCTWVGNTLKAETNVTFGRMSERQHKWCKRVLLHNLRVGIQVSTINKVWEGLIKTFEVALAQSLESSYTPGSGIKLLEKVRYPVFCDPKLDGLRMIAVKKSGVVTLYTRSGTEIETLPMIKKALQEADYDDFVLDGEALDRDNSWNTTSSVMMSSKSTKSDENMVYNVFDVMALDEWEDQNTNAHYTERVELRSALVAQIDSPRIVSVPHVQIDNDKDLVSYFAKCTSEGFEGIMIKDPKARYEFKRSRNVLKLKPVMTTEFVVTGWYEGRDNSKREGLFGGFYGIASNGVITRLGGGYKDTMLAEIQLNGPGSYVGMVAECEGQPDVTTEDGLTEDGKLRFPVWCRWRDHSDVDQSLIEAYNNYCETNSTANE